MYEVEVCVEIGAVLKWATGSVGSDVEILWIFRSVLG